MMESKVEVKEVKEVELGGEVSGFLVISSLPSKALLERSLPKFFEDVKIGLEIIRLIQGYFYNRLGVLARKFYNEILPRYTIKTVFGYILPPEFLNEFTREVEALKKEYEEYERDLVDFLLNGKIPDGCSDRAKFYPEYLEIVKKYLQTEKIEVPEIASRVRVDIIPFVISKRIVEAIAGEELQRQTERLISETKREIFESIQREIEEQLKSILQRLKEYQTKRINHFTIKALKKDLDRIISIAYQYNINSERVKILKEIKREVDEIAEKKITVEASGRLGALLANISEGSQ
jgi:DNA-directed RNA polymerase beta' subunit